MLTCSSSLLALWGRPALPWQLLSARQHRHNSRVGRPQKRPVSSCCCRAERICSSSNALEHRSPTQDPGDLSVGWWLGHWRSVAALSLPVPAYSQGLSLTHSLDPNCYLHCGMEFTELG